MKGKVEKESERVREKKKRITMKGKGEKEERERTRERKKRSIVKGKDEKAESKRRQ